MIRAVTVKNYRGEELRMELTNPERSGFIITAIDGLGPVKANINSTECANADGARYNSARLSYRNITMHLTMYPYGNIENLRQKTYKYFPIKQKVNLEIETDNRICVTEGYVEANEPDIFSSQESTNISIMCPYPYFYSGDDDATSVAHFGSDEGFEFPFSNESLDTPKLSFAGIVSGGRYPVVYDGDSNPGVIIHIFARGSVVNPGVKSVTLNKTITISSSKLTSLTGSGVLAGDEFVISTIRGNKYATLIRNGESINILSCLGQNAGWFWLVNGKNMFSVSGTGDISLLRVWVEYKKLYEGI